MVQIISGAKGKGKTKFLIQKANDAVKAAEGNIVYLDKNSKHMYELSNKIRLINVGEYPIDTYDTFIGFLTISKVSEDYIGYVLNKINEISHKYSVDFTISISIDADAIPDEFKKDIIISL